MAKKYKVELTRTQAEALGSFAEMTLDRSGCTFGDWADANPQSMHAVENALAKLEAALAKH